MTDVVRAEWTKFRTVRLWVIAIVAAAGSIIVFGLFTGAQGSCHPECVLPVGPEGQEVSDSFTFVHQPLTGDGTLTARVASFTGALPSLTGRGEEMRAGLAPWAKAGLIVKASTQPGSAYAAVMLTGSHGVRLQHNFVHDRGAEVASSASWLRLVRHGATITAYASVDGSQWTTIGDAELGGLPTTVEVGLFVTSPQYTEATTELFGLGGASGAPSQATAVFDHLDRDGSWPQATWTGERVGGADNPSPVQRPQFDITSDTVTATGSGDIAPAVAGASGIGATVTQTLVGTFAGLIIVVVIAALNVAGEYRRGLIRTTLAAMPRRGLVLFAKVVVVGAVTFAAGLVAAAIVVTLGQDVLRANGVYVHPASVETEVTVTVGTAALLAVAAILALALGVLLRRGVIAVTTAIVVIVMPYLLALTVLPAGAAEWVLRVTPAAAFAVQQSTPEYVQVDNLYVPASGYFPLPAWAGFGVLAAWTALALFAAAYRLRRSDV